MPVDKYSTLTASPIHPSGTAAAITPDDASDLPQVTVALNVATHGSVRVTTRDGSVTDVTIAPGYAFPLRVTRVWESGTTATGICGLY